MNLSKTPLVLISGFLGAGKTTFLRHLLPQLGVRGLRPHLIINDYGEAEIDAAALAELAATVRAINGSCVCCESQEEFLNLLANEPLAEDSVLLVETNGTTDPYEIIEALGLDPRAARYLAPIHVSVIDAQRWQKRWWHNALERLQVRSAGYHYVSKSDVTPADRTEAVAKGLCEINPQARRSSPAAMAEEIAGLRRDEVPLDEVFSESDVATYFPPAPTALAHNHRPHDKGHAAAAAENGHAGHDHEDAHQFVSLQIPLPPSIAQERMAEWLKALPREVIRAKGFVRLEGSPDRLFSFQKVEDSHEIAFLPLSPEFAREPLALLIGTGISAGAIPAL